MFRKVLVLTCMIFFPAKAMTDNLITIDQIGDNNNIYVSQQGSGHQAQITTGTAAPTSSNDISVLQKDTGAKLLNIDIPSGNYNTIQVVQDGAGNHNAGIQNLNGNSNNISIAQDGSGNHSMSIVGTGTNTSNTVTAVQIGNTGANKDFVLSLNGSQGANVNIRQDNPLVPDSSTMSIQCLTPPCGNYSYIKH